MNQNFFKLLAKKTARTPSRGFDQRVLQHAELVLRKTSSPWKKWALLGTPIAAALVIWIQLGSNPVLPHAMLAESPEMIRDLDDIELWSDVADLSEAELRYLETGKS
jgi:hypothetical protein